MQIVEPHQIQALQQFLLRQSLWVERRVDQLTDLTSNDARWIVDVQLVVPNEFDGVAAYPDDEDGPLDAEQEFVISIGYFDKRRYPDLQVVDASGARIPILDRQDRAQTLATVMVAGKTAEIAEIAEELVESTVGGFDVAAATWDAMRRLKGLFAAVASLRPSEANAEIDRFLSTPLTNGILEHMRTHCHEQRHQGNGPPGASLSELLRAAADYMQVLVWVKAVPGHPFTLQYTYTEPNKFPRRTDLKRVLQETGSKGAASRAQAFSWAIIHKQASLVARYVAMKMSLVAVPFRMSLSGAGHATSYYFQVKPPNDVVVEALYWHKLQHRRDAGQPNAVRHASVLPTLACHDREVTVGAGNASVDLRLDGAGLRSLLLTILAIGGVAWAGQSQPHENVKEVLPVIAVLPGAVLAALARRTPLASRISGWLGTLLSALAALSILLGIVKIGNLLGPGQTGLLTDRALATAVGGLSGFLFVVVGYLCFLQRTAPEPRSHRSTRAYSCHNDVARFRHRRRWFAACCVVVAACFGLLSSLLVHRAKPHAPVETPTVTIAGAAAPPG